ncbi:hypothetical protein QBC46DRAFT_116121 [Diplogelasinospora grovesii]|uniref:Uncharacterized protein n=1 Tax=Diplogelasinospora grovesii TaxID=303347 RepID=A0AAN6S9F2_9PEZI|nr:hypothetical protein QBC46DRAFT_116121 [Diplogelasinospora grovesii]
MGAVVSHVRDSPVVEVLRVVSLWSLIAYGAYIFYKWAKGPTKQTTARRGKIEDRRHKLPEPEGFVKKAKNQRAEAFKHKPTEISKAADKSTSQRPVNDMSNDKDVDDAEFARRLVGVKQGAPINTTKKTDQKRQKSVKQSRVESIEVKADEDKISAPSSAAGADADADDSSITSAEASSAASPNVKATAAGDVSDMLEPSAAGPSVLRVTNTDKVKQKQIKTKTPEKVETKKQRQNRQKIEAAKAIREETEKQRQKDMEAQRRLARISEGRPAKDGSTFTALQPKPSVWAGAGANGLNGANSTSSSSNGSLANGEYMPVLPLDTLDTSNKVEEPKASAPTVGKAENWISSLPSEEEQMELLRSEEAWNTVQTKRRTKPSKKDRDSSAEAPSSAVTKPQQLVPVTSQPAGPKPAQQKPNFAQQSSFAALSTDDTPDVEEEVDWAV